MEWEFTVAKDKELLALPGSDLAQQRQQIKGYTQWVLAHESGRV